MATKLIAFRISGDLLEKAQILFGDENIVNEARNLLIEFIEQRSPKSENNLTPNQTNVEIEDLKKRVTELENQRVTDQQIINLVDQRIRGLLPVTGVLHSVNTEKNKIIEKTPNTEKYYRVKLLERLGMSTKASKDQIIPKLKKLGVIVDRNCETFYQEACNQLGIV